MTALRCKKTDIAPINLTYFVLTCSDVSTAKKLRCYAVFSRAVPNRGSLLFS